MKAGTLQQFAVHQQVTHTALPAPRGSIVDRNGVELAISESAADVIADPYLIKDPNTTAQTLSPLLGKPVLTLLSLLTKPHTGFVYLAHMIAADKASAATKLMIDGKPINGITTVPETTRYYPRGWAASQVLGGYASFGGVGHGYAGLEYEYNSALRGTDGTRRVISDAKGQPISIQDTHPTKPGQTLQLTIDAPLQDEVEQVLAGVGATYQPKGATAIVMDPNTGQVLALANWPRVNANDPTGAPAWASEDRAVGFTYEPGSTFKAITVAGALSGRGGQRPRRSSTCRRSCRWPTARSTTPSLTAMCDYSVSDILRVSSNIGADLIGRQLGARRFDYWVHRFGFGSPTGVDLPGEERGIVLHWWQYSGSSMGNLPMGQGESVTPMQMAAAYSAIANGGHPAPAPARPVGGRQAAARAGRPPGHLGRHRARAAPDAARRARRRRHRLGGGDPGL